MLTAGMYDVREFNEEAERALKKWVPIAVKLGDALKYGYRQTVLQTIERFRESFQPLYDESKRMRESHRSGTGSRKLKEQCERLNDLLNAMMHLRYKAESNEPVLSQKRAWKIMPPSSLNLTKAEYKNLWSICRGRFGSNEFIAYLDGGKLTIKMYRRKIICMSATDSKEYTFSFPYTDELMKYLDTIYIRNMTWFGRLQEWSRED